MTSNPTINKIIRSAVSTDPHRRVLHKIARETSKDGTFLVSTDAHRMVVYCESDAKAAPSRVLFDPDEQDEKVQFPNWERVIPTVTTGHKIIAYDLLRVAISCVLPLAKLNCGRCFLKWEGGKGTLGARYIAPGAVSFDLESEGGNFEVAVNCAFLRDLVPACKEHPSHIRIDHNENVRPLILTYCDANGVKAEGEWGALRMLIMPMWLT